LKKNCGSKAQRNVAKGGRPAAKGRRNAETKELSYSASKAEIAPIKQVGGTEVVHNKSHMHRSITISRREKAQKMWGGEAKRGFWFNIENDS